MAPSLISQALESARYFQVQVQVPEDKCSRVHAELTVFSSFVTKIHTTQSFLLILRIHEDKIKRLLDVLDTLSVGTRYGVVDILPLCFTMPRYLLDQKKEMEEKEKERAKEQEKVKIDQMFTTPEEKSTVEAMFDSPSEQERSTLSGMWKDKIEKPNKSKRKERKRHRHHKRRSSESSHATPVVAEAEPGHSPAVALSSEQPAPKERLLWGPELLLNTEEAERVTIVLESPRSDETSRSGSFGRRISHSRNRSLVWNDVIDDQEETKCESKVPQVDTESNEGATDEIVFTASIDEENEADDFEESFIIHSEDEDEESTAQSDDIIIVEESAPLDVSPTSSRPATEASSLATIKHHSENVKTLDSADVGNSVSALQSLFTISSGAEATSTSKPAHNKARLEHNRPNAQPNPTQSTPGKTAGVTEIRAERFVVLDKQGRKRGFFGLVPSSGTMVLTILDSAGNRKIQLEIPEEEVAAGTEMGLYMCSNGVAKISQEVTNDGSVEMQLTGPDDSSYTRMQVSSSNSPEISLGTADKTFINLYGTHSIHRLNPSNALVSLRSDPGFSGLSICDTSGGTRATLGWYDLGQLLRLERRFDIAMLQMSGSDSSKDINSFPEATLSVIGKSGKLYVKESNDSIKVLPAVSDDLNLVVNIEKEGAQIGVISEDGNLNFIQCQDHIFSFKDLRSGRVM